MSLIAGLVCQPPAQSKDNLFSSKCSGCHTIGGGDAVGPDLAQTKEWTDDKLKAAVEKMAAMSGGLTGEEITALVSYLKNPNTEANTSSEKQENPQSEQPASKTAAETDIEVDLPGSYEEGKMLYFGQKSLENGGMSCISCHQSGSPEGLGPDLSRITEKYKGRALVSACKQAPFKVMQAAYRNHPITEAEALNLAKYLSGDKNKSSEKTETEKPLPIPAIGGGAAIAFLAMLALGYRNRNRGVREKLKRK